MSKKIVLVRRGSKHRMPEAAPLGELLYCKDTNDLFVGTNTGIQQLTKGDTHYDGGYFDEAPSPKCLIADGGVF